MNKQPALFLDRDGVIVENRAAYIRTWDDIEIYPQALSALAQVRDSNYKIIIVTNQSGIGRGLIQLDEANAINTRLVQEIEAAGGRIDGVFMCPHAPEEHCDCRKPKAGLLLQATAQFNIDLGRSIMIGDALTDLGAGQAAGVPTVALLRTGRGTVQSKLEDASQFKPLRIYDNLTAALQDLV